MGDGVLDAAIDGAADGSDDAPPARTGGVCEGGGLVVDVGVGGFVWLCSWWGDWVVGCEASGSGVVVAEAQAHEAGGGVLVFAGVGEADLSVSMPRPWRF